MHKQRTTEKGISEAKVEKQEITFQCKFCGDYKKLGEMRTLARFFPLITMCQECERNTA